MLNIKKLISRNENKKTVIAEDTEPVYSEIDLNKLFYVVKYGEEINLKIKNDDLYEQGVFTALNRKLLLDGIKIEVSQWADWIISITLVLNGTKLKVAESIIPNEYINWDQDSDFVKRYSKLKWVEKGNWCKELYDKINFLKCDIDNKKKEVEQEITMKKAKENRAIEEEQNKKRSYFENIYNNNQ